MGKIQLRNYQEDIIKQSIKSNKSTLIQIPTGGGKTLIAKEIITCLTNKSNQQVLFIAPKIILMEQTAEVFKELNPHIVHRNEKYDKDHKILVSTIQTASRRDIYPDVIIIDEIHYGFEGKSIEKLIKNKPDIRIIGLSATPYDKDGNLLKGFGLVLDKYDTKYMVENGYLVNIESHVLTKIRGLDKVKIIAGDYNLEELGKIVSNNKTILEIVGSTSEYIEKYKKTIVFAVDINHAELLTKAYKENGFIAEVLHSKLEKKDNDKKIKDFKENKIKILVSVQMLTTGFDVPDVDVAIIARPTKSQNLYKQMVGRVLRLAENKTHAILLDCGNVIENLGEPLEPIVAKNKTDTNYNKQKCEECKSENIKLRHIDNKSFWECQDCKHKKSIEQGTYECKICGKLYSHDADFEIKNDKLYLKCLYCPYPTMISQYTDNMVFIETKKTNKSLQESTSRQANPIKQSNIESDVIKTLENILKTPTTALDEANPDFVGLNHHHMLLKSALSNIDCTTLESQTKKRIDNLLWLTLKKVDAPHILLITENSIESVNFLRKYENNVDFSSLTLDNLEKTIANTLSLEGFFKQVQKKEYDGTLSDSRIRKLIGTHIAFLVNTKKFSDISFSEINEILEAISEAKKAVNSIE